MTAAPPTAAFRKVSDASTRPQLDPFAALRIDRGIVGRGRFAVSRDAGPELAFGVGVRRADGVQFGSEFRREFVKRAEFARRARCSDAFIESLWESVMT